MVLSPKVAQSTPYGKDGKRPARSSRNSPYGGMNVTSVSATSYPNKRSQAQDMRSTRGRSFDNKEEKGKKSNDDTFHALKMQRSLASVPYGLRTKVKSSIADIESFQQFPLLEKIQESIPTQALLGSGELVPSPIQRLAIPVLLGRDSNRRRAPRSETEQFLIAAETGSGKTLAYLLPVIHAVKQMEMNEALEAEKSSEKEKKKKESPYYVEPPVSPNSPHATSGRPRAIILVPTAELVDQVAKLTKSFSHTVKFRAAAISAAYSPQVIRNRLFGPDGIDILISTPHLLSSILVSEPNVLSRVTHIVFDEADSLMDRSFAPITTGILDKAASSLKQIIMCSATISRSLDTFLRSRFPDMRRLVTPNLHAIPRRVQLGVVDVVKDPYRNNKDLACADTIYTIGKAAADDTSPDAYGIKHLLVFVNEREKTEELADYLQSKGIDAAALHRDTEGKRRAEVLTQFTTQPVRSSDGAKPKVTFKPGAARSLPNTKVLVTTDLGSRGIDTLAVRHVILYDVPHSTIDFIHRLGRTGRMGRRGRGIVLVGKDDRRDVVREVREGMFRGQALI